jgi:hypothetical protein
MVWIVAIIVTATASPGSSFKWENLKPGAILIELVGFAILVFGNLVYSDIVVVVAFMKKDK